MAEFRKDHRRGIDAVSAQLVDIALTKLIGEVSDRKRDPIPSEKQADLFLHYPGIPEWITIPVAAQNCRKCHRMLFSKATIGEVESWIKEGGRTLRPREITHKGVTALLKDIETYATSPDTTIKNAYKAMATAKTKAA